MNTQTDKTTLNDVGLLAMRLMVGVVFVLHGSQKLFGAFGGPGIEGMAQLNEQLGIPLPLVGAWLAALAEFFGGLALITGFAMRLMAVPLVITMLVAAFAAHWPKFFVQNQGMEYPLVLTVIVAGLGLIGPGAWTVTKLFQQGKEKAEPTIT